jgi:protein O-GlcNAcase/histone acetyltransferase
MLASIQSDFSEIPEDLVTSHPAELRIALLTPLVDPSVPKRLMTCVLAAFRANGKQKVYVLSFTSY